MNDVIFYRLAGGTLKEIDRFKELWLTLCEYSECMVQFIFSTFDYIFFLIKVHPQKNY